MGKYDRPGETFKAYAWPDDIGYAGMFFGADGVATGFRRLDGSFEPLSAPTQPAQCGEWVDSDGNSCPCNDPTLTGPVSIQNGGCCDEPGDLIGRTCTISAAGQEFKGIVTGDRDGILTITCEDGTIWDIGSDGIVHVRCPSLDRNPKTIDFAGLDLYAIDPLENDPADDWKRG